MHVGVDWEWGIRGQGTLSRELQAYTMKQRNLLGGLVMHEETFALPSPQGS